VIKLQHRVLIYIPSYNVEERLVPLIDEIPDKLWDIADVMVIDNRSTDNSYRNVIQANEQKRWPKQVIAVQTEINLGYSGSQQMAYGIAMDNPNVEAVVMLHGDGQYSPVQVEKLLAYLDEPYDVVYGYRSWRNFFGKDETPISSYITIKVLSLIESLLTGYFRREWHSGFVMYKTGFLRAVNFENITKTMHIDGHLLFAAGKLKKAVKAVPIFKRYKNYPQLLPTQRMKYVLQVLWLMPKLHFIPIARHESSRTVEDPEGRQSPSAKKKTTEVQP